MQSPEIKDLAAALARAQAVMTGALKDSKNPFYKSNYADLESVWSACRKALTDHGLSVLQYGERIDGHDVLVTRLVHSSGQWVEGSFAIKAKDESPQALGSAITYARRYGLAAMVGVYQTDDDAEAAQGRAFSVSPHPTPEYKVDTEIAVQFADGIKRSMKNPRRLLELHTELNADMTLYDAVVALLNTAEKKEFREGIMQGKKLAASPKPADVPF